jgi:hypothetical protein
MSPSNSTVTSRPVDNRRSFDWLGPVLIAVFTGIAMLALARPVESPRAIPRLTIVNPSDALVDIDASDDGAGWLPLTIAEPRSSVTVRDVVDQGDQWIFRFRVADQPVGQVRRTAEELARAGWRVEIPQSVVDRAHGS